MATVQKCKLNWKPSESDQVVGNLLYRSKGNTVGYDSNFFDPANVVYVYLTDILKDVPFYGKPIMLGGTAVDEKGNESRKQTDHDSSVGEGNWVRHLLLFEVQMV